MSSLYYKGLMTALLKTILYTLFLVIPLKRCDNVSHELHLQHEQGVLSVCLLTFLDPLQLCFILMTSGLTAGCETNSLAGQKC